MEAGEAGGGLIPLLTDEVPVHRSIMYWLHMESFLGQTASRRVQDRMAKPPIATNILTPDTMRPWLYFALLLDSRCEIRNLFLDISS